VVQGRQLLPGHFRGADFTSAEIDRDIAWLRVNGVEIGPMVEAELDRRHPGRAVLEATTTDAYRAGWAALEAMWAPTMERVAALAPGTVDVEIDGATPPVDDCIETIVSEEWHHHRYALRDLATIEAIDNGVTDNDATEA
jgi:hypothetical protein